MLWKASNDQYAASHTGSSPTPYEVNKNIARHIRVRHARRLPLESFRRYLVVTSLDSM